MWEPIRGRPQPVHAPQQFVNMQNEVKTCKMHVIVLKKIFNQRESNHDLREMEERGRVLSSVCSIPYVGVGGEGGHRPLLHELVWIVVKNVNWCFSPWPAGM